MRIAGLILLIILSGCAGKELRKAGDARELYRQCISREVSKLSASKEAPETIADGAMTGCSNERAEMELHLDKYSHRSGKSVDQTLRDIDAEEKKIAVRQILESRLK